METLVRFGPQQRLLGILSGSELPANAPILVLPSAGLVPRAGPFRLHVEMAQRLAARGVRTFRFDVPGVGEAPREAGCDYRGATLAALEQLTAHHGGTRFVVGGVCSAADLGWIAALANERVVGALMLDGMCYTGPWFQLARIRGMLASPRRWLGFVRRLILRGSGDGGTHTTLDARDWPTRAEAQQQMQQLLMRNVRLLFIYSGGISDYFRDVRQFGWSFGRAARDTRVTMLHWPDCDHTYYTRVHRDRLLATVEAWLGTVFVTDEETAA